MYVGKIIKFIFLVMVMFIGLKILTASLFEYLPNKMATNWKLKSAIGLDYNDSLPLNIILGSSRTLALYPEKIQALSGQKFINLSVPSAQLPYVYYMLKRIIEQGIQLNSVYIDIPASNNMGYRESGGAFNENFIRYFIQKKELLEYGQYNKSSYEYYYSTRKYAYNYVNKDLSFFMKGFVKYVLLNQTNKRYRTKLLKNKGYTLIGNPHYSSSSRAALVYRHIVAKITGKKVPKVQTIYLEKLITLLTKHHIRYKFFFSPFPYATQSIENLGFGNYVKLLATIPYQNIETDVLILDDHLFIDGSHPNLQGSDEFNQYFVQKILNIDLNKSFITYPIELPQ